ncbi:MAG: hypothetical protein COX70_07255 [Flavobacteriales bacterium CG_4_10_14_0_2_um_filter_32_8]|nr:MAG: hypothetical protein COX70_07255 [Flavobacteriales bacterium CG_4_10_14_0_2_um_filter_32_8]
MKPYQNIIKNNEIMKKLLLIFILLFLKNSFCYAQDGSIDSTFGVNGIVITDINGFHNYASSSVLQSDGKIILTGYTDSSNYQDFAMVRYNNNGSLDNTFGVNGIVITDINGFNDVATSSALQSDGKILLSGYSNNSNDNDFAVVRYNTNGSLDSTFGINGKVITPIGSSHDNAQSIVIQPDNKIVLAGSSNNGADYDFALIRYKNDGDLDSTFGVNGLVLTDIGSRDNYANHILVDTANNFVVVGSANNGLYYQTLAFADIALARYKNNGSLDSIFGTNGIVTTQGMQNVSRAKCAIMQQSGKILVTGETFYPTVPPYPFLVRYNNDGSQDAPFSLGGVSSTASSPWSSSSLALQSDGKILIAAYPGYFIMNRKDDFGNLDSTFGNMGIVETNVGVGLNNSTANKILIQNDGKIILTGDAFNGNNNDFVLIRYNNISSSINENKTHNNIILYPNPNNGLFTLKIDAPFSQATLAVFDVTGKRILQQNITQNESQLNLLAYPKGMYFYQVIVEEKVFSGKVMVN